jgi:hypothetical protein
MPIRKHRALAAAACYLLGASTMCDVEEQPEPLVAESCASCHAADYARTTEPQHSADPVRYHQACVDCHSSESWSPALTGPHPEDRFQISDGLHDYPCLDCHSLARGGSSEKGADTDCVGCHTGAHSPEVALGRHRNVPSFQIEEYVPNEPPWCMECHYGGLGFGKSIPHPEAEFPVEVAPHDYECQECHDTTRGKTTEGNTNCTGCHDDGAHSEAVERLNHLLVEDYVFDSTDPAFCLKCHAEVIPGTTTLGPPGQSRE